MDPTRSHRLLAGRALAAAVLLAGCGSAHHAATSGSRSGSAAASSVAAQPSDPAAAKAAVTANWQAFFATRKAAYLQRGDQFAQALAAFGSSPVAAQTTAKVDDVTFVDAGHATVHYDIVVGGTPQLANQTGAAVLEDGTWKVSDTTFCGLLSLQGGSPACAGVH